MQGDNLVYKVLTDKPDLETLVDGCGSGHFFWNPRLGLVTEWSEFSDWYKAENGRWYTDSGDKDVTDWVYEGKDGTCIDVYGWFGCSPAVVRDLIERHPFEMNDDEGGSWVCYATRMCKDTLPVPCCKDLCGPAALMPYFDEPGWVYCYTAWQEDRQGKGDDLETMLAKLNLEP